MPRYVTLKDVVLNSGSVYQEIVSSMTVDGYQAEVMDALLSNHFREVEERSGDSNQIVSLYYAGYHYPTSNLEPLHLKIGSLETFLRREDTLSTVVKNPGRVYNGASEQTGDMTILFSTSAQALYEASLYPEMIMHGVHDG